MAFLDKLLNKNARRAVTAMLVLSAIALIATVTFTILSGVENGHGNHIWISGIISGGLFIAAAITFEVATGSPAPRSDRYLYIPPAPTTGSEVAGA